MEQSYVCWWQQSGRHDDLITEREHDAKLQRYELRDAVVVGGTCGVGEPVLFVAGSDGDIYRVLDAECVVVHRAGQRICGIRERRWGVAMRVYPCVRVCVRVCVIEESVC